MIRGLYKQFSYRITLEPTIVLFALISGINNNLANIIAFIIFLQLLHKGNQGLYIAPVSRDISINNELIAGCHIDVISRFQLAVAHIVFLHVHKGRIVICLAVAVPVSADMDIRNVLFVFADPVLNLLDQPLQDTFVVAFPVYEFDSSLLDLCFQLLHELF